MSPYCILGWENEHVEGQCTLQQREISEDEPLGITATSERATRTPKEDSRIADVKSTGRKRAVQVKPITGQDCEWKGLRYAGGAVIPVIGCPNGIARQVHHGPSKSTLNNRLSNLHAICDNCHGRFHTLNDQFYPEENIGDAEWLPEGECVPHDAETKATVQEILENETWWVTPRNKRTTSYPGLKEVQSMSKGEETIDRISQK